ncbi:putative embryo-specific protein [Daldinia childiae]|uniref:putative embryo-specific protein n=1 Tax=Daldinia childiae TaxID=326645 RepID=UPI001447F859|nr:putative embryo-specific protein [Daldinia childiae]KAF3071088.1 putative embryo-specific protein [Daldinia childiae]
MHYQQLLPVLSTVLALLPLGMSASLPFGHYGPEGTVLFLNGFHFVSGHSDWEISANHYCVIIRDDMLQCAVYNTATAPARLAGIEYIISSAAFETLDYEERQLWHSHVYEVTSGFLTQPGLPASVDHTHYEGLVGTYGKTFHTWRYDQQNSTYPIGIPELVMGYTGDNQITPDFVTKRDELFGLNTTEVRESRSDIQSPQVVPGADSWKYGYVLSLGIVNETTNTSFPNDGEQVVLSS